MSISKQDINAKSQSLRQTLDALIKDPSIPEQNKLNIIIHLTALTCALVAVQPIPFADLFILSPIQVVMVIAMSRVLGNPVGKDSATEMIASIVGVVGWGVLAQQVVLGLYKTVIPFMGAFTTIPLVYAATIALGYGAKAILHARNREQKISQEELKRITIEARQKAKQEKISLEEIKRQLKEWQVKAESYQKYQQDLNQQQIVLSDLREKNQRLCTQIEELQSQQKNLSNQLQTKINLAQNQLQEKNHQLKILESQLKQEQLCEQTNHEKIQELQQVIKTSKSEVEYILEENSQLEKKFQKVKQSSSSFQILLNKKNAEANILSSKLKRLKQQKSKLLQKRIKTCYPNLKISDKALEAIVKLDNEQIYKIERQFGLLQYDIENINFKCIIQGTKNLIREIQVDNLRIYLSVEGNIVTIALIGKKSHQNNDIKWLRQHY